MKKTAYLSIIMASLLTACSTTGGAGNSKLNYQSDVSKSGSGLEVPPDLTAPTIQDRYAMPKEGAASLNQYNLANSDSTTSTVNQGSLLSKVSNAHIEREGNERWLVVEGKTPAEVWPLLKSFWQDNGFTIKTEEPQIGLMTTDWAENRAQIKTDFIQKFLGSVGLGSAISTPERDMFRIRVEKTANGTDIYFTHRGMYETYINEGKSETRWEPRPADPGLEAAFLGRFMQRLGMSEDQAKLALQNANTPADTISRASIQGQTIVVNDGFDRAWRRVGLALDRVGLNIVDQNRADGVYYVSPAKDEVDANGKQSAGFWSSLAFWKEDAKAGTPKEEKYLVKVTAAANAANSATVEIFNSKQEPVSGKVFKAIADKLVLELK